MSFLNCGSNNPTGKRFCGDCVTALTTRNSTAQLPVPSSIMSKIAVSAKMSSAIGNEEHKTVTAVKYEGE
jgi:hypothetical protein